MLYTLFLLVSFTLAAALSLAVKKAAFRLNIVDYPSGGRKIHTTPTPLLGGVAIFLSFFLVLAAIYFWQPNFFKHLSVYQLLAMFIGAILIMIGGYLDDKHDLPAKKQIIWPFLAALAIVFGGVNLKEITNPFGGTLKLTPLTVNALVFAWLMGMMYTTKFLDGLDGLVAGLGSIGSLMIFFLSLTPKFFQADLALVALIFVGALLGFLLFNFYPAKIFLGEGGSLLVGFVLGVLAIVSGSKIATALLVMGIPAADVLLVAVNRLISGRSPFTGDSSHLHHRLLSLGLSARQTVIVLYLIAAVFGVSTLFLQSRQKFTVLLILFMLAVLSGWHLIQRSIK